MSKTGNATALTPGAMGKRRAHNLATNQIVFRQRVDFNAAFDMVLKIELQLLDMVKPQLVFDQAGNMEASISRPEPAAVAALKTVLDSAWKRVHKSLPDLKPVDVVAAIEEDQDITSNLLNPIEMKKRVLHALLVKAEAESAAADQEGPSFLY